jgi:hypothetical protein
MDNHSHIMAEVGGSNPSRRVSAPSSLADILFT